MLMKASQARPGRSSANRSQVEIVDGVAVQKKTVAPVRSTSTSNGGKKSPVRVPPKELDRPKKMEQDLVKLYNRFEDLLDMDLFHMRAQDRIAPLVEWPFLLIKVFYPVILISYKFAGSCCKNLLRENSDSLQHIFVSPSVPVRGADLYLLFQQVPRPFIVLCDFNSHSPLWRSDRCDSRGRLFEKVFNCLNLCVLNDGSSTYCHPAIGTKSMLDLSMADPSLYLDLTWTVMDDLHRNDLFPVLVQFNQVEKAPSIRQGDFRNVTWDLSSDLCTSDTTEEAAFSTEDPALQFTHLLTSTSSKIIPQTQCKPRLPTVPWFTEKCKTPIKKRKKSTTSCFSAADIRKYTQIQTTMSKSLLHCEKC